MNARERNRAKFSAGAELKDLFASMGGQIVHAENFATGETIGERDPGPWVDGIEWVRAMDAHRRWFGVVNRQPDAAPKRRAMTDAQRACLRGDV